MRDKKGKFAKGNKFSSFRIPAEEKKIEVLEDVVELRRKGYARILRKFKNMAQMTVAEFKAGSSETRTTIEEAAFMSFFKNMIESGDVARMKFYFATYGIPTDLKAIAVQEMNTLDRDIDDVGGKDDEAHLTKEEKLSMIEKMKLIVDSIEE